MPRPSEGDFLPYFQRYIDLVNAGSVAEIIANHQKKINDFYNSLPEEKADYAYADGKWTIKEVLQHVTDTERVFAYRGLRFARKDVTPLASFDENAFAKNALASHRTLASLKEEFSAVRLSSDLLLQSFTDEQLNFAGIASNHVMTANAVAFLIYGHLLHHQKILQERYL